VVIARRGKASLSNQAKSVDIRKVKRSCKTCSLAELSLPRGLSKDELNTFSEGVIQQHPIHRGDHLFRAGDNFRSIYIVKSGSLKVYINTPDGSEQIVGFHMAGELLGLDGLDDQFHTCSALALETTSLCELPFNIIEDLCKQYSSVYRELCAAMGREIVERQAMLLVLGKRSAEERIATFLLSLSKRFNKRGFSGNEFNLSMSRHDIANNLGLAPETVSRQLVRLHEENILTVEQRHVQIHDAEMLHELGGNRSDNSERAAATYAG
jgi:CRP/FNR family transcriptional regulator|tara:strand:+ start:192 stop:992 length:801 start_codon:yes stop_codon:yes gene_type:complete